jgi:lipopolysaccharide/colanic/teichoic acid biosynthesis glycosyltransferase
MTRRLLDLCLSSAALTVLSPLLVLVAVGVLASDGAPVLYRACRVGWDGSTFSMLKYRSMRLGATTTQKKITGACDPRVFPFGRLMRLLKLDELPQLVNIVKGDMAVVGPRPEDPSIVERWYTEMDRETLQVRPGLTSPGSIWFYTQGERLIGDEDPEGDYVRMLMPTKLALDVVYVRDRSLGYDLRIVMRTAAAIVRIALGIGGSRELPELGRALDLVQADATARRVRESEQT